MSQIKKLDNLIVRILKEELGKSQKGMLDVTVPEKFARILMDPRVSDNPSYIDKKFITSKDGGKNYNIKIQSKTPEFKQLKRAMRMAGDYADTPELEKAYDDVMTAIEKADIEGSVDLIKKGRKSGLEEGKKLYPVMQDDEYEENVHYLGSDGKHDYYYDEQGGSGGSGTFMAQFGNEMGQHTSGFDGAYYEPLNKALKMAYEQNLLTNIDKKKLKEIEMELRKKNKIKDGVFTLPEEGLDEEEKEFITSTGTGAGASADQRNKISKLPAGTTVTYRKPGEKPKVSEQKEQQLESVPTGTEIAGQVAEIVDKLKAMSEGSEDPKKKKFADKIMKQMESAKAALEALTAHEVMLEEKEEEKRLKDAEKHVKGFKKHLTKLVKEPAAVEKIAAKMTPEKMADLKKKVKSGELDEEKLARVMLQHSLKEGWIK